MQDDMALSLIALNTISNDLPDMTQAADRVRAARRIQGAGLHLAAQLLSAERKIAALERNSAPNRDDEGIAMWRDRAETAEEELDALKARGESQTDEPMTCVFVTPDVLVRRLCDVDGRPLNDGLTAKALYHAFDGEKSPEAAEARIIGWQGIKQLLEKAEAEGLVRRSGRKWIAWVHGLGGEQS